MNDDLHDRVGELEDAVDGDTFDTVDDAIEAAMNHCDIDLGYRYRWDNGEQEAIRDDAPEGYVPVGIGPSYVWFTPEEYTPAGADLDDLPLRVERLAINFAEVDT